MCLTILSIVFTLTCFGQTLFFDNLETSTWLSVSTFSDSLLKNAAQIPLSKLNISKDSIRENVSTWNFEEGILTISYFDIDTHQETPISTYPYKANRDKGVLTININKEDIEFEVGITSTGNNALLIRKKAKRKKRKSS